MEGLTCSSSLSTRCDPHEMVAGAFCLVLHGGLCVRNNLNAQDLCDDAYQFLTDAWWCGQQR